MYFFYRMMKGLVLLSLIISLCTCQSYKEELQTLTKYAKSNKEQESLDYFKKMTKAAAMRGESSCVLKFTASNKESVLDRLAQLPDFRDILTNIMGRWTADTGTEVHLIDRPYPLIYELHFSW